MDESKRKLGWLEWIVIIALVFVAELVALALLGPEIAHFYQSPPDALWLHLVGR